MHAGAAIPRAARKTWAIKWASGWFWQLVPKRFHVKATASSRMISTPRLARLSNTSTISYKTSGLAQLRSHWNSRKVVQTHAFISSTHVKFPGAMVAKTSGKVASYASGTVRSGNAR